MKNELNASSQRTQTTLKSSTYNVQIGNCTWALAAAAAATAYALLYNVHDAYVSGQKNLNAYPPARALKIHTTNGARQPEAADAGELR